MAERLAKKAQDGTLKQVTREPQDKDLEAMELHVGDTYHQQPSRQQSILPWILAAALGAGGLGMIASQMVSKPDPQPQAAPAADQDTRNNVRISSE